MVLLSDERIAKNCMKKVEVRIVQINGVISSMVIVIGLS